LGQGKRHILQNQSSWITGTLDENEKSEVYDDFGKLALTEQSFDMYVPAVAQLHQVQGLTSEICAKFSEPGIIFQLN
jgi:hypothetical protein